VLGVFVGSAAPAQWHGAGVQGVGTAAQSCPWVQAGLGQLSRGAEGQAPGHPGQQRLSLGAGTGSSSWRPPLPHSTGVTALGCFCPLPLFCPGGPHFSHGQGFPPRCDYQRMAQPQPCGPADTRGIVPACSQGTIWTLGLDPPLSKSAVASASSQCSPPVVQMSLAVVLNDQIQPPPSQMMSSDLSGFGSGLSVKGRGSTMLK